MKKSTINALSIAAVTTLLAACGSSDGTDSATGSFSLGLTDAPVDSLESVFITFNGVAIKPANGTAIDIVFDAPKTLDLLALQNGNVAPLVDDQQVIAGNYEWMRLDLSENAGDLYVIDDNNAQHTLTVPSGAQTGLKLVSGFTVLAGGSADFTIDFDLRKSVTNAANINDSSNYILKPALRLVDNSQSGSIVGTVDATTVIQTACADAQTFAGVVYVFEGQDAVVDDFGGTNPEALVAVPVSQTDGDGVYAYQAAFLPVGGYTVAYTCDLDDMEADEDLNFVGTANVDVTQATETTFNFE